MSLPAPTLSANTDTVIDMSTHTYTMPGPLALAPIHETTSGKPVPVVAKGTVYRQGQPFPYMLVNFPTGGLTQLIGYETYLVSEMTVTELDAFAAELDESEAFDRAYDAQLADAKEKGLL